MDAAGNVVANGMDADAAFARLEELVAMLPDIQTRDQLLMRAREARNLLDIQERTRLFKNEIAGYKRIFDQALRDAKTASDTGDTDAEGYNLALVRMYDELRYTRLATMERAENELREMLAHSELTLDDPLASYALSDEEYQRLEDGIHAYQEEYQKLYEYCLSLEQ
jgi:hypothetical protein